jgi:hypothetical protein
MGSAGRERGFQDGGNGGWEGTREVMDTREKDGRWEEGKCMLKRERRGVEVLGRSKERVAMEEEDVRDDHG